MYLVSKQVKRKTAQAKFLFLLLFMALLGAVGISFFNQGEEKSIDNSKTPLSSCGDPNLSGEFLPGEKIAFFEGKKISVPQVRSGLAKKSGLSVLGAVSGERWIEVDLSEQKLTAWDGEKKFLETLVSSGLPWTPTPTGEFHIWTKFRYTKMEGGQGKYYYNLPNVPYVMFFENENVPGFRGYGLHGTYWHNDFGKPHSHGCVNLPTPIAEKLYEWTNPTVPEGKSAKRASDEDPGTRIVIHE